MHEQHRQYPPPPTPFSGAVAPPPPEPYRFGFGHLTRPVQWAIGFAVGTALVLVAAAGVGVNYMLTSHARDARQISQLRQANSELAKNQAQDHLYAGRLGSGLGATWDDLQPLLPFTGTCSQDFTGPNGPAQYYIPCTSVKPGSTSTG